MRKKLLSVLLCTAMAATLLTGCGGSDSDSKKDTSKKESSKVEVSDGGKVLNIRVWNEEFKERVVDCYPGYEKVDDNNGKIGDVEVKWTTVASKDNAYQNALDEALTAQSDAAADDKVDIFLVEADYALKYVDTDYTVDIVNDLGISEDTLADQYQYTKDIVTDSNGKLKGASWQGCPAGMVYRRDIAKQVFGTDDPAKIQENFKDWDSFKAAATKLKEAGYNITASANDTYRVFSNNVTSPWVKDGKISVDENIKTWVDMNKELVDAKQTGTYELWGDDWTKGFTKAGNAFCYFGPAWFIDFSLSGKDSGYYDLAKEGGWALTEGPQSFFWGGTWVCAANGTDNKSLVKDIIETMTADEEVLTKIAKEKADFTNSKKVMSSLEEDKSFGDDILGGQNPISIFTAGIDKIDMSNTTSYDQTCNEEFQTAMKEYFEGKVTYEEALESFYKNVETKHPELSH